MAKVAWISDAGRPTGFSRATHAIAERLVEDYGHEIHVMAIGWDAADPVETPLKMYRSEGGPGRQYLGFDRMVKWILQVQPDVVFILEDPAILIRRLLKNQWDPKQVLRQFRPILAYLPIDGINLPPELLEIEKYAEILTMSRFGQRVFPASEVVYHGVDPEIFHEVSPEAPITLSNGRVVTTKAECKEAFSLDPEHVVIGRIDTNSGRKDWARQWMILDEYFGTSGIPKTTAFFHTKRSDPGHGANLDALISRSPRGRYAVSGSGDWPVEDVVGLINAFDFIVSASRGEGFGFNFVEAAACGVPAVAIDCSAITEVVGPGGILVAPETVWTNPYGVDLQLADVKRMARAAVKLARDPALRARLGRAAKAHALATFNWDVETEKVHKRIQALAGTGTAE
jgi:glycosyltransferase involved in cell wall biosynthesis